MTDERKDLNNVAMTKEQLENKVAEERKQATIAKSYRDFAAMLHAYFNALEKRAEQDESARQYVSKIGWKSDPNRGEIERKQELLPELQAGITRRVMPAEEFAKLKNAAQNQGVPLPVATLEVKNIRNRASFLEPNEVAFCEMKITQEFKYDAPQVVQCSFLEKIENDSYKIEVVDIPRVSKGSLENYKNNNSMPYEEYLKFVDKQLQLLVAEVGSNQMIFVSKGKDDVLAQAYVLMCEAKGLPYTRPEGINEPAKEAVQYIQDEIKKGTYARVISAGEETHALIQKADEILTAENANAHPNYQQLCDVTEKIKLGKSDIQDEDVEKLRMLLKYYSNTEDEKPAPKTTIRPGPG